MTSLCVAYTQPVDSHSLGTIFIMADGSVWGTDKIQRNENIYTFTGNIDGSIVVQKDNIVIDGAGYTLQMMGGRGLNLTGRSNVEIKNMQIVATDPWDGIYLKNSSNNKITGNKVTGNYLGIYLWWSNNNTVTGNTLTSNTYGISIDDSSNNLVTGNNLTNNRIGIQLDRCSNNVLKSNRMYNNDENFDIFWNLDQTFVNNVDASNTVDGKPIYYWIGKRDKTVPSDAGCVVLVNCTRMTVQNLKPSKNGQGILLAYTTNSRITKNTIADNSNAIALIHSSNNTITGNNIETFNTGIQLEASSENTITGNNIVGNSLKSSSPRGIRPLHSSNNNIISGNNIRANDYGIDDIQSPSAHNIISRNNITANDHGIALSGNNIIYENNVERNSGIGIGVQGGSNKIIRNNVKNNGDGIYIFGPDNMLRKNRMENNKCNFKVYGLSLSHFVNDIDVSNTVDGKPIYYWVNQRDRGVPTDAGCVVLVNCTNIIVQNLKLAYNGQGILLAFTTNSTVTKNIIMGKSVGIMFYNASNNHIIGNEIVNNENGIYFSGPALMADSRYRSTDNIIHHNNFVNNQKGIYDVAGNWWAPYPPSVNIWDDGYPSGGNYWSNYNGTDNDGDGIGDTPYTIYDHNIDRYPLMKPVTISEIPDISVPPSPPPAIILTVGVIVTDSKTGQPIPDAVVYIDAEVGITNTDGVATIDIALGANNMSAVQVWHIGYETYADNVHIDKNMTLQIPLVPIPSPSVPEFPDEEPFPITWIIAAIAIIAVVGATLLVYFAKVKKTTGKAE